MRLSDYNMGTCGDQKNGCHGPSLYLDERLRQKSRPRLDAGAHGTMKQQAVGSGMNRGVRDGDGLFIAGSLCPTTRARFRIEWVGPPSPTSGQPRSGRLRILGAEPRRCLALGGHREPVSRVARRPISVESESDNFRKLDKTEVILDPKRTFETPCKGHPYIADSARGEARSLSQKSPLGR